MARTNVDTRTDATRVEAGARTVASYVSPYDTIGLVQWLKADAITGKVDNDAVSSWLDSSGRGTAAIQATGSKQPLYKTSVVNSLPVVRGDGTDDAMTVTQTLKFGAGTVFLLVANWPANGVNPSYAYRNNAGTRTYITRGPASANITYTKGSAAATVIGLTAVGTTGAVLLTIVWKSEGGSQTADYYKNSTTIVSDFATTLGTNGTSEQLFSFDGTQQYAQCDIAELVRFERVLSTQERELVRNSLLYKYNLEILPVRATTV